MWAELSRVYHLLDGAKGVVAILVACIAVIGVLTGAVTSYLVSGRTVYINSITAERSKWIEKLRVNLAAYSGGLAAVAFRSNYLAPTAGVTEMLAARRELEALNHTASVIQLQLNPWGEIDRNILKLIDGIVIRTNTDVDLIDRADKLLIAHSQWLLKAEWEKVKFEARSPLYRATNGRSAKRRLREYQKWGQGEGAIDEMLAAFAIEKVKPIDG